MSKQLVFKNLMTDLLIGHKKKVQQIAGALCQSRYFHTTLTPGMMTKITRMLSDPAADSDRVNLGDIEQLHHSLTLLEVLHGEIVDELAEALYLTSSKGEDTFVTPPDWFKVIIVIRLAVELGLVSIKES